MLRWRSFFRRACTTGPPHCTGVPGSIPATKPLMEHVIEHGEAGKKEQTKYSRVGSAVRQMNDGGWDWRTMGVPPYSWETSICCRVSDD
jgi:hypothetical protein